MKDEQIVRKVDHSEWDCQLKKKQKKLLTVRVGLFSLREKAPTKKLATVIVGHFSLEKRRLKTHGIPYNEFENSVLSKIYK